MKIAGSGALNLDMIYEVPDLGDIRQGGLRLAAGHETWGTHAQAQDLRTELERTGRLLARSGGGSAANTICALAGMGFDCSFIGSVGEDEEGAFILESMQGVDCSLVTRKGKSSLCIIVLGRKRRDRAMFVAPGPVFVDPSDRRLGGLLREAALFHFTSLVQDEGISLQAGLLSRTGTGTMVSFDPGEIYAAKGRLAIEGLLGQTDLLFSTDYELSQLFGNRDMADILKRDLCSKDKEILGRYEFFRDLPPPVIARKMGSKGAVLLSVRGNISCPAKKVDAIVDNTGAGDAFNAGVLSSVLSGRSARKALEKGIDLAAYSLKFPGRSWIDSLSALKE